MIIMLKVKVVGETIEPNQFKILVFSLDMSSTLPTVSPVCVLTSESLK